jgi:hypothetical protein
MNSNEDNEIKFEIKTITFFNRIVRILCQNRNGPCPLLAIANTLLLQNKININPNEKFISLSNVIEIIANILIENSSTNEQHSYRLNTLLECLPKLSKGLDLNIKFNGVNRYEFLEEVEVFDVLNISLVHG